MNYHEDGYGGFWYDDTPLTEDDPDYDGWYEDMPDYDYYYQEEPTWRDKLRWWLRGVVHSIRMIVDRHYREHINDLPF